MNRTLQTMHRTHVVFDPTNSAHRDAYWELRTKGVQHPDLRFVLEAPYMNVLTMMQAKIADHYSAPAPVVVALRRKGT